MRNRKTWEEMSLQEHMAFYEEQGYENKDAMKNGGQRSRCYETGNLSEITANEITLFSNLHILANWYL